ncbi:type IV toxin-antitoxin system AbiEi family antitoxin [Nocardia asteroides]|uniref:type IV toxin-antitoxin system AbiEi family antitoxin n=1 Tax=Nocardia asteroides TaxID=1824 RepID=UPI00343A262B
MDDRTIDPDGIAQIVARAMSALSVEFTLRQWTSNQTAIVELGRKDFVTTYQMAWLPHITLSALSRLDRPGGSHRLLIAGPQISSRTAAAFREAQIDYIDDAGNAHLDFGPVLIDIRGRHSPTAEMSRRPSDANLFSTRRMQVLFAVLAWPDLVDRPVRMIADTAGTSVGIAQSTLEILKGSDYVIGRSLHRRDELIDLWAAAYRGSLLPKIRESMFAGEFERWSPPPGHQVSGESAIETIRQPQTLTIYVRNFDPIEAIENGWRKSAEPNIEIRRMFWSEPPWADAPDVFGAFTESAAPPLMVYADLLASGEPRQVEVANALRRDELV